MGMFAWVAEAEVARPFGYREDGMAAAIGRISPRRPPVIRKCSCTLVLKSSSSNVIIWLWRP